MYPRMHRHYIDTQRLPSLLHSWQLLPINHISFPAKRGGEAKVLRVAFKKSYAVCHPDTRPPPPPPVSISSPPLSLGHSAPPTSAPCSSLGAGRGLCTGPSASLLFHQRFPSLIFLTLAKISAQKNPSQCPNLTTRIKNDCLPSPGHSSGPQHSILCLFPL